MAKKHVNVMTPRAPVSIRIASTVMPRGVNVDDMSTGVSPVMHTALVDTKSESMNDMPWTVQRGSMSSRAPMTISSRKLTVSSSEGLVRLPGMRMTA